MIAVGLVLAGVSTVALNGGYALQHRGAATLPPLSIRRPLRSLASLFRQRRWLTGFLVGIAGWAFYVAALRFAPLSLVQAASAGGVGVLAAASGRLTRLEGAGVGAALAGLLLLGLSLGGRTHGGHGAVVAVAAWVAASLLVAAVVSGGGRRLAPGAALGSAAGILYAAGDVATKAAVVGGARLGFVPVLLACHGAAFVLLQLSFQRGGPLATAGLATLWTNALPIAAGTAVFAESFPGGGAGVARASAFALVVAGSVALARRGAGGAGVAG